MFSRHDKWRELRGDKVILHPWRRRDDVEWVNLRRKNRAFLQPFEPFWGVSPITIKHFDARFHRAKREAMKDTGYAFLMRRLLDNSLVGGMAIHHIRRGALQCAAISYWLGEEFTRQGCGFDALTLLQNFAFHDLDLHRLEAYTLPHNQASIALLTKSAFTQEGIATKYLCINGIWQDHLRFYKLAEEA